MQCRRPQGVQSSGGQRQHRDKHENKLKLHHRIFDLICKRFVVGWVRVGANYSRTTLYKDIILLLLYKEWKQIEREKGDHIARAHFREGWVVHE